MKSPLFIALLGAFVTAGCSHTPTPASAQPRMTETEVLAVAEAAIVARYSADLVAAHRPYHATFRNGLWGVSGTVPAGIRGGGAPETIVRDSDGKVFGVSLSR